MRAGDKLDGRQRSDDDAQRHCDSCRKSTIRCRSRSSAKCASSCAVERGQVMHVPCIRGAGLALVARSWRAGRRQRRRRGIARRNASSVGNLVEVSTADEHRADRSHRAGGYVTSQPDPLTVLVDLRNVAAGRSRQAVRPIRAGRRRRSRGRAAPDGAPVARVRVALDRPAAPRAQLAQHDPRRARSAMAGAATTARRCPRSRGRRRPPPASARPAPAHGRGAREAAAAPTATSLRRFASARSTTAR